MLGVNVRRGHLALGCGGIGVATPVALAAGLLLLLPACSRNSDFGAQDRDGSLSRDDFRQALAPRNDKDMPPLPRVAQPIKPSQPSTESLPTKLVSVSADSSIPVRDVLYSLAQQAGV